MRRLELPTGLPTLLLLVVSVGGCEPAAPVCATPVIYGHRGTVRAAPENTLAAFDWALASGAEGIEVDVRETSDGEFAVIHDSTMARTTNGGAARVDELTLEEIQTYDAGTWFGTPWSDERVPSLEQVFDRYGDSARYLLDVKSASDGWLDELGRRVLERGFGPDQVMFASPSLSVLGRLCVAAPEIPAMWFPDRSGEVTEETQADVPCVTVIRVPIVEQDDLHARSSIGEAGYRTSLGGSWVEWGMHSVIANNAERIVELRKSRTPEHCSVDD